MDTLKNKLCSVLEMLDNERAEATDFLDVHVTSEGEIYEKVEDLEAKFTDISTEVSIRVDKKGTGYYRVNIHVRSATEYSAGETLKDVKALVQARLGMLKTTVLDEVEYFEIRNGFTTLQAANETATAFRKVFNDYKRLFVKELNARKKESGELIRFTPSFKIEKYRRVEKEENLYELVTTLEVMYASTVKEDVSLGRIKRMTGTLQASASEVVDGGVRGTFFHLLKKSSEYVKTLEVEENKEFLVSNVNKLTSDQLLTRLLTLEFAIHYLYDPTIVKLGYDELTDQLYVTNVVQSKIKLPEEGSNVSIFKANRKAYVNNERLLARLKKDYPEAIEELNGLSINDKIQKVKEFASILQPEYEEALEILVDMDKKKTTEKEMRIHYEALKEQLKRMASVQEWPLEKVDSVLDILLKRRGKVANLLGVKEEVDKETIGEHVYLRFIAAESKDAEKAEEFSKKLANVITDRPEKEHGMYKVKLVDFLISIPKVEYYEEKFGEGTLEMHSETDETTTLIYSTLENYKGRHSK